MKPLSSPLKISKNFFWLDTKHTFENKYVVFASYLAIYKEIYGYLSNVWLLFIVTCKSQDNVHGWYSPFGTYSCGTCLLCQQLNIPTDES